MKIERISDNQIRCTLTSFDLNVRNINLVELAYGTEKAKKLFREMIQKASNEVGFEADDIPLMVEAIPLSGESIMLVITKIEDPEELDTRFAKFSPLSEDDTSSLLSQIASDFLEGAQDALSYLDAENGVKEPAEPSEELPPSAPANACRIFRFDNLDRAGDAARAVDGVWDGKNVLYKKPGTRQYYLVLTRSDAEDNGFSRACNILSEYASRVQGEFANEAYFKEHYDVMIQENALQNLLKF
jgi:adapter protein MecA 1/2